MSHIYLLITRVGFSFSLFGCLCCNAAMWRLQLQHSTCFNEWHFSKVTWIERFNTPLQVLWHLLLGGYMGSMAYVSSTARIVCDVPLCGAWGSNCKIFQSRCPAVVDSQVLNLVNNQKVSHVHCT